MADKSKIEWTDATWNIVTGCSVVSPACTNCYAMRLAGTRLKHLPSRAGLTREVNGKAVWTGEVRFNDEWLLDPLKWKRPRKIFVAAHGDLFHESVPDEWLDRIFAVMALAPQHTFQVLTKRPKRMRAYITSRFRKAMVFQHIKGTAAAAKMEVDFDYIDNVAWPFPNIWLGVTAEDQSRAEDRIPYLLETPAAMRFVSCEPLLGAIDLRALDINGEAELDALHPRSEMDCWREDWAPEITGAILEEAIEGFEDWGFSYPPSDKPAPRIDLVIAGGESGPGARPSHPDWFRGLRDQCTAAGTPFFFKQWGDWKPICEMPEAEYDRLYHSNIRAKAGEDQAALDDTYGRTCTIPTEAIGYGGVRGDAAFHVVEGKGGMQMFRVGKHRAGRTLDGREHNGEENS